MSLKVDAQRYGISKKFGSFSIFFFFFKSREFRIVYLFRKRHEHREAKNRIRSSFWAFLNYCFNGTVYIDENAKIGSGLVIVHAFGIAIGKAQIGKNCTLRHNVTIGAKHKMDSEEGTGPIIGDNVQVGPGAVILGSIKIGSNVIVGANSVVLNDFPDESIIAGNPAKIIGKYDDKKYGLPSH